MYRTININKRSEYVKHVYIYNVEVKLNKNDGEIEIRIVNNLLPVEFQVIRVPMLENGDMEINKVFSYSNDMSTEEMLKIVNEVLA